MTEPRSVSIDVVSDVVCPWCYIGMRRLQKAIAAADGVQVTVRWRPFQLDPTIPMTGKDRQTYLLDKFQDEQRIRQMHERLEALGAQEGIDFDFEAISVSPNTLDAHRVIRWAAAAGPETQGRLVGRLFEMYFEHGADLGDHAVLSEAAQASGLDAAVFETLLATDKDRDEVREEIAIASDMGVQGVPCFLFESRYVLMGAQEPEILSDAIRQIADAKARGDFGPDA